MAGHAATSRDCHASRGVDFAVVRFTAGLANGLTGFSCSAGVRVDLHPTITSLDPGRSLITFPASYKDDMGNSHAVGIVSAEAGAGGATGAVVTATVETPNSVSVTRRTMSGSTENGEVLLTVQARVDPLKSNRVGHYGAALDKAHSVYERQPYALWFYRQMQEGRGSGIDSGHTFAHAENFAIARAFASLSRAAESVNANALARSSYANLDRFERDFALVKRPSESKQDTRQRAAAFEEAPQRNDRPAIDLALKLLLGDIFVRTWWHDQSTPLTTETTPTFWGGGTVGPTGYDLGGGTWLSARANFVVEVNPPRSGDLRRYLELLNVDMPRLLNDRLPATYTYNWATGLSAPDGSVGDGFNLDIDQMDFTGMT